MGALKAVDTLEFLHAREKEIAVRIAQLRAEISPLEIELGIIQEAMAQLNGGGSTIKQLCLTALTESFPEGTMPAELREHIKRTTGRDIARNSLSPQLARLRLDGLVQCVDGLWMASKT